MDLIPIDINSRVIQHRIDIDLPAHLLIKLQMMIRSRLNPRLNRLRLDRLENS